MLCIYYKVKQLFGQLLFWSVNRTNLVTARPKPQNLRLSLCSTVRKEVTGVGDVFGFQGIHDIQSMLTASAAQMSDLVIFKEASLRRNAGS